MKNLQKAGGICSLIASATYIFAMALVLSVLSLFADTNLSFQEYISFVVANKTIIYIWHFSMYFINGICLTEQDDPHVSLREKLIFKDFVVIGEFNCAGFNDNSFLKVFGGMNKGKPNEEDLKRAEEFARDLMN